MKRLLLHKLSLRQTVWALVALGALPFVSMAVPRLGSCECGGPAPIPSQVELEPLEVLDLARSRADQLEELFALNCEMIFDVRHHEHEPEWFSGRAHHALDGEVAMEWLEPDRESDYWKFARFTVDGKEVANLVVIDRLTGGSYLHARSDSYLARLAASNAFDALLTTAAPAEGTPDSDG